MTHCIDCGAPWGVIGTDDAARAELEAMIAEWFGDRWRYYNSWTDGPKCGPPPPFRPEIYETEVVFVTEASWKWLGELGFEEALGDCWQELDLLPAWWAKPRAKKALRVNCCELANEARELIHGGA